MENRITFIISVVLDSILGTLLAILGIMLMADKPNEVNLQPKIDLPEEYENINPHEQLQGNYDRTTNTLHIWFNNNIDNND